MSVCRQERPRRVRGVDDTEKQRTVNDFTGAGLDGESGEGWGQKLGACVETGEGRGQSAGEGGWCCWSCGGKGRCPVPSGK